MSNKNSGIILAKESPVQSQVTVSNTDIVTMLVVEQRKVLAEKRAELVVAWALLVDADVKKLWAKIQKAIAKVNPELMEAVYNLIRILNPKKEFEVSFYGITEADARTFVARSYRQDKTTDTSPLVFKRSYLELIINAPDIEDEEEDRDGDYNYVFNMPWRDGDFRIPCKIKCSIPYNAEIMRYDTEIDRIDQLTRNETKLRDELVARVTKNVIADSAELSGMVSGINLLD